MKRFTVTGMSCAACSARVEKAVLGVNGVEECAVSLLTNSMTVKGNASDTDIIAAVEKAGYSATVQGGERVESNKGEKNEFSFLLKRLAASVIFLVALMYISMGHVMWGFPLPSPLSGSPAALALTQLLLTVIVLVINQRFFINGFKGIIKGAPNMDTLVALGSASAFVYSTYLLYSIIINNSPSLVHGLYFESSAMIVTLITVGKMLEAKSKSKTTDALGRLIDLAPKTATVIRDGKELTVGVKEVTVGDIFTVKAGESIPVDGVVLRGSGSVDQSALTGESVPVYLQKGNNVSAACSLKTGFLECKATGVGEDTVLAKIIKTVSEAVATKAPVARIADKVSGIFVPVVTAIALLTVLIWLILGQSFGYALARGISVLVISCPCALGLATPVAITVGSGVGAKKGILFKNARALENTGKSKIVILDKTGTITNGTPVVTNIYADDQAFLLSVAASLEKKSEHPLSAAIVSKALESGVQLLPAEEFATYPGKGVSAFINGKTAVCGSFDFVKSFFGIQLENAEVTAVAQEGKTPVCVAYDGKILGVIAVADTLKEDSAAAVHQLKKMGIRVIMLTGDNELTANRIAESVGIETVMAQQLPHQKLAAVQGFKKDGRVLVVGDGINDAPALAAADTGAAMGSGADITAEEADIVLMNSRLTDVVTAIRLSRAVLKNIKQNLFWAFAYNTLGIPLAAGAFVSLLGWELSPMFGAAAMSLSSFCVVTNALRLNLFKANKNENKKEKNEMNAVMKIEGMMCPHCEARVKAVLEELEGVESAVVSHKDGTARVAVKDASTVAKLKETVENAGYKVISIDI